MGSTGGANAPASGARAAVPVDAAQASVGRRIAERRRAAHMTQGDLAERVGARLGDIDRYENDVIAVPDEVLAAAADALGTTVSVFRYGQAAALLTGHALTQLEEEVAALRHRVTQLENQADKRRRRRRATTTIRKRRPRTSSRKSAA